MAMNASAARSSHRTQTASDVSEPPLALPVDGTLAMLLGAVAGAVMGAVAGAVAGAMTSAAR